MTITDSNITINVKDMDKSIAFYQSLGLTLKTRWGNHYAQVAAPGITIGLHPSKNVAAANGDSHLSIGFRTDNFDEAKTHLENLSIPVQARQEEGGQFLHFNDP